MLVDNKRFLSSKLVQTSIVISCAAILMDIPTYQINAANSSQETQVKGIPQLKSPLLSSNKKDEINKLYHDYFVKPKKVNTKPIVPKKGKPTRPKFVRPVNQNGMQDKLFTQHHQLTLKAIINNEGSPYALIAEYDEKTKQTKLLKINSNTELHGYSVKLTSQIQVDFHSLDSERVVSFQLYKKG
ncbi:hypothetical protein [Thalassotalea fusca]